MPMKRVTEVQSGGIKWDTDDDEELRPPAEGRMRDTDMYLNLPLWKSMKADFGGVVTHLKTSTDLETGDVKVCKAGAKEPGAVEVRSLDSGDGVQFSWLRPLRKLGLRLPTSREFKVTPRTEELHGLGTVYIFPMAERISLPRHRNQEGAITNAVRRAAAARSPAGSGEVS